MNEDILENTRDLFEQLVGRYDTDGELRRQLSRLLERHQMDIRNMFTSNMVEFEIKSRQLGTSE